MNEISGRQKLALLDGGYWINTKAAVLRGETVKTVIMPRVDKALAIKEFLSGEPFDDSVRNYQITIIPDYFQDTNAIDELIEKHIVSKKLVDQFEQTCEGKLTWMTAAEKSAALIKFLKL